MSLKNGTVLGHFEILAPIGAGGMGEVYLAQDTTLDRKVALKFLPEELDQDSTARKRFLREAKSAAALDHPYICHIHEVGEVEGKSFISMEYVQGTTLKEKLTGGPLPLKEALKALALVDSRKSQVVELRFFGGLTVEETAEVLKVSSDTVLRDWRLAKVWLLRELSGSKPDGS